MNYASTSNIREVIKFYIPGDKTIETDFSISLLWQKMSQNDGVVHNSIFIEGLSTSESVHNLLHYYTDVPPLSVGVKGSPLTAGVSVNLQGNDYKSHKLKEDR